MKIATWNVNGIRARTTQVRELDRARAARRRLPAGDQGDARAGARDALRARRLLVLLARRRRLLGRRPARAQGALPASAPRVHASRLRPRDAHRRRRTLGDVVLASVYVPNGGKDFAAKIAFLEALERLRGAGARGAAGVSSLCGDLNVARTERDVHPKERKPSAIGQRPEERALLERLLGQRPGRRRPRARSRQRRALHLVGAVAQHAPAQHRLAARLRPRQRGAGAVAPSSCVVLREFGTSDHAPVVATFDGA